MPPNSTNAVELFDNTTDDNDFDQLATQPQQSEATKSPCGDPPTPLSSTQPQLPIPEGTTDPKLTPKFHNIVSTVNLSCELDLKHIAVRVRNAEYSPKRFPAVIMRIREPKTTALIFKSGKMVCTGSKSVDQANLAARKFARIVQKVGFEIKFVDFKIRNVVATCDVEFVIKLGELASEHFQFSSFEPEVFPGLVYRMVKPKVVLLIFVNGRIVLTGAKCYEEIHEAMRNIYPTLKCYMKPKMKESEKNDEDSGSEEEEDEDSDYDDKKSEVED